MLLRPAPLFRIAAALLVAGGASTLAAQDKILNASFDVSRELFREINPVFRAKWKADTGRDVDIEQSHVGSTQQARAVLDGLQADVVTLNQQTDMDALMRAGLVATDWRARLPFHAAPYTSIVVFVVRAGNPKHIRDWDDLLQPGIRVSLVNPKTSGNGRYAFLGAWAFASSRKGGGYGGAKAFVAGLYRNVPVLDLGGRAATSTFADRGLTDVLITFESEGRLLQRKFGAARFEIVTPSITLLAEFPVSVVDAVVNRRGTRKVASAYLDFLYSKEGQRIIAHNGYRPRISQESAGPAGVETLNVDQVFGGWTGIQARFFADGGIFDQIYETGH